MTIDDKIMQIENVKVRLQEMFFHPHHAQVITLTESERNLILAALEVVAGVCTILKERQR